MTATKWPARVAVREVGPRDGLQPETPVPPADRARLVDALVAAGVREIEVAAFVSPKAVPAMAGATEVFASIERVEGARYWALVPNVRGAQLAMDASADALSVTVSASETYSQKNVHMTIDQSVATVGEIAGVWDGGPERPIDAVISCAFGSPYEGDIPPAEVAALTRRLRDAGASSITLADTTGMASPPRVEAVLRATGIDVGLHLHETRGTGLVNAYAAMAIGVQRFDTSVGGLGGSPFAAGAAGNLATEDLIYLLDELGVSTAIDLARLVEAAELASTIIGRPVPGRVAAAGPRTRLHA
jgi:hydroxymethylglutaryl-CoA lyase